MFLECTVYKPVYRYLCILSLSRPDLALTIKAQLSQAKSGAMKTPNFLASEAFESIEW